MMRDTVDMLITVLGVLLLLAVVFFGLMMLFDKHIDGGNENCRKQHGQDYYFVYGYHEASFCTNAAGDKKYLRY